MPRQTLPNGTLSYFSSQTYDELNFRILFPTDSSQPSSTYFYLDGTQQGCDGIYVVGPQDSGSVESAGYACELTGLSQIGSVHNLTVVITNSNGSTYQLHATVITQ